jgi:hypothetical protein
MERRQDLTAAGLAAEPDTGGQALAEFAGNRQAGMSASHSVINRVFSAARIAAVMAPAVADWHCHPFHTEQS